MCWLAAEVTQERAKLLECFGIAAIKVKRHINIRENLDVNIFSDAFIFFSSPQKIHLLVIIVPPCLSGGLPNSDDNDSVLRVNAQINQHKFRTPQTHRVVLIRNYMAVAIPHQQTHMPTC